MRVINFLLELSFGDWCNLVIAAAALSPLWAPVAIWMHLLLRFARSIAHSVRRLPETEHQVAQHGKQIAALETTTAHHGQRLDRLDGGASE